MIKLLLVFLILSSPFYLFAQTKNKTKECAKIISFGVMPQDLIIKIPKPKYPNTAKALGIQDDVSVQVKVNRKGKVIGAKILKGHILLHKVSLDSVWNGRFKVFKLSSGSICYFANIVFKFSK